MGPCDDFQNLFLDLLYGLLHPEEEQRLRGHLDQCPACQEAMKQARGQQNLLARAAQVYSEVPVFEVPGKVPAEVPAAEEKVASGAILPLPAGQSQAGPPTRNRRRWPWLAAAAAVLLAAGSGWRLYQRGLERRKGDLALARTHVEKIDAQAVRQQKTFKEKEARLPQEMRAGFVHLHVAGPARHEADAPSPIRVVTQDLEGKPLAGLVSTQLLALDSGKELFRENLPSKGELVVTLPPSLARKTGQAQLIVKAGDGQVEETIRLEEPAHVTHLAMNKAVYQVGEVLFFRTLTLQRFSLRPPEENIILRHALKNAQGQVVKVLQGPVGPGGIGGGEFALTEDLADGEYTLEITGANSGVKVLPQARRLEIVREPLPQFQFDRPQYRPGDPVTANVQVPRGLGGGRAGKKAEELKVKAQVDGKQLSVNGAPPGAPARVRVDAKGAAPSIQFRMPAKIDKGKAFLEVQMKNRAERVPIPVVGSRLTVDFFPEGGNLVAGVANRVYYRVRTPLGEPIDPEGYVILLSTKDVTLASERGQGLGVFTFIPEVNEKYTLRVTSSRGMAENREPFKNLGIMPAGVVLKVPEGVSREGEPLRVTLTNTGPEKRLVLLATCRGQVVAEEFLTAGKEPREVRLMPVAGTRGVVRLTVYEASRDGLVPLAERLVYRLPAERLEMSIAGNKAHSPLTTHHSPLTYHLGEHVNWQLRAVDEKGKKTPAWMLAMVVDEKVVPAADRRTPSLPAHFHLLTEVRHPQDLENADLLLADTPESRKALDLFLGTQGWRRFVPAPEPPALALAREAAGRDRVKRAGEPALFSRENNSPEGLVAAYKARVEEELGKLRQAQLAQRQEFQNDRERHVAEARLAAVELARFRNLPAEYLRMAVGCLVVLLLGLGGVFLLAGLVRLLRRSGSPTGYLAGAFGSLLACLVLYVSSGSLPAVPEHQEKDLLAWLSPNLPPLPGIDRFPELPEPGTGNLPPLGLYAALKSKEKTTPLGQSSPSATTFAPALAREGRQFLAKADRARGMASVRTTLRSPAMQQRFANAKMNQEQQAPAKPGYQGGPFANLRKEPQAGKGGDAAQARDKNLVREYHYQTSAQGVEPTDTLLWHPALRAGAGSAQVDFDLPRHPGNYRIFLFGNTANGRLGGFQGSLQVRP